MRLVAVGTVGGLALLLAAWLAASPAWASAYDLAGRAVRVADGDTFTLQVERDRSRQRIRLASIDAPEIGHGAKRPGQPFGQTASRALRALVDGQRLRLACYEADRYGRHVCDVKLPDGRQVSHALVDAGLAWANQQSGGKYLRDRTLPERQAAARRAGHGLWKDRDPVPPWTWRVQCWRALETAHATPKC